MTDSSQPYRIDYEDLDVEDLMRQVRARARAGEGGELQLPEVDAEAVGRRLHDYLELDDRTPYELQQTLSLGGPWNVTPEDLRSSHPGAAGTVIRGVRGLLRPLTKLLANLELPLYKQFKINLGVASALHDLMQENAGLRRQVSELARRIEQLERDRKG
jgi:hypothetical protein